MDNSLTISVVRFLCVLAGLGGFIAYGVTFYVTSYNEIYFSGHSGYDETDLPYTLAIVECVVAGSMFIIGHLSFATTPRPSRNAILCAAVLFASGAVLQGVFGVIRGTNLGLIGSNVARTCSDTALSGCPTTRYENTHNRDIMFSSPYGGQCTFWFWGPDMKAVYETVTDKSELCNGWSSESPEICLQTVEKYMDWSEASSYGWCDDIDQITALLSDTSGAITIDKQHNMEKLFILQETAEANIPAQYRYVSQPSLAYCWYWGCSEVCQSHRFLVNRWWFFSSFVMCIFNVINFILTLRVLPPKRKEDDSEEEELNSLLPAVAAGQSGLEEGNILNPVLLNIGRRRRLQNPSGLLF